MSRASDRRRRIARLAPSRDLADDDRRNAPAMGRRQHVDRQDHPGFARRRHAAKPRRTRAAAQRRHASVRRQAQPQLQRNGGPPPRRPREAGRAAGRIAPPPRRSAHGQREGAGRGESPASVGSRSRARRSRWSSPPTARNSSSSRAKTCSRKCRSRWSRPPRPPSASRSNWSGKATCMLQVVGATGQVKQLEEALNENLNALVNTQHFDEMALNLTAAIQLLCARMGYAPTRLSPDAAAAGNSADQPRRMSRAKHQEQSERRSALPLRRRAVVHDGVAAGAVGWRRAIVEGPGGRGSGRRAGRRAGCRRRPQRGVQRKHRRRQAASSNKSPSTSRSSTRSAPRPPTSSARTSCGSATWKITCGGSASSSNRCKLAAAELNSLEGEHYDDRKQAQQEIERLQQLIDESRKTIERAPRRSQVAAQVVRHRALPRPPRHVSPADLHRVPRKRCRSSSRRASSSRWTTFGRRSGPAIRSSPRSALHANTSSATNRARPTGKEAEPYPLIIVRPKGVQVLLLRPRSDPELGLRVRLRAGRRGLGSEIRAGRSATRHGRVSGGRTSRESAAGAGGGRTASLRRLSLVGDGRSGRRRRRRRRRSRSRRRRTSGTGDGGGDGACVGGDRGGSADNRTAMRQHAGGSPAPSVRRTARIDARSARRRTRADAAEVQQGCQAKADASRRRRMHDDRYAADGTSAAVAAGDTRTSSATGTAQRQPTATDGRSDNDPRQVSPARNPLAAPIERQRRRLAGQWSRMPAATIPNRNSTTWPARPPPTSR